MSSSSTVQLTESTLHDILDFVAAASTTSQTDFLYDSLRELGRRVLHLNEMVIGRCSHPSEDIERSGTCSEFGPLMSLADAKPGPACEPAPSAPLKMSSCCGTSCAKPVADGASSDGERMVVCHQGKVDTASLCIVSVSNGETRTEDLVALLKTLIPYVDKAFQRISAHTPATAEPPEPVAAPATVSTDPGCAHSALTQREKEILQWTAKGKGCWETGLIVGISERTVKFHLQNIYRKLNVVNRAQAIAIAARTNLLQ